MLTKLNPKILIFLFLIVGIILFLLYKDMPLVRNSLVYARIIFNIDDLGSKFVGVNDGYNKPLGFAYLSYPFYKAFDATIAMKIISSLATAIWGISVLFFFKRFAGHFNVDKKYINIFLLITLFNPLVIYQFISAYPDMLYALSFLWSAYFLDRVFSKDIKIFDGILFGLVIVFSIWVKHNGFIIFPLILIFLIGKRKEIVENFKDKNIRKSYITALISVIIATAIILWGYFVDNPVFNFGQNAKNFLSEDTSRIVIVLINLFFVLIFFVFTVNIFGVFTRIKVTKENRIWLISILVFVLSLLFYHGTKYNIRYYITILPFLSLLILSGWQNLSLKIKRITLGIFILVAILLNIFYNTLFLYDFSTNTLVLPKLDNLRLNYEQIEARENIDLINKISKEKNIDTLYFISSYYSDGQHKVWERENEFNSDLRIEYYYDWKDIKNPNTAIVFDNYKSITNDEAIEDNIIELSSKVFLFEVTPSFESEN